MTRKMTLSKSNGGSERKEFFITKPLNDHLKLSRLQITSSNSCAA